MADNPTIDNGDLTDVPVVGDEITSPYTGDTAIAQGVKLIAGAADSAEPIDGTTANGLEVDVTRVQGTVTVGDGGSTISVDDGAGSLTVDGTVAVSSIAAGDNNIGNVDVASLPALPAGTNNIGDVDVLTLPALPAGTNNIGDVDVASIAAGTNIIGKVRLVDADGDEISVVAGVLQTSGAGASFTGTRIAVTPTISTAIYAAKDCVGGVLDFANAAATSGGWIELESVQITDKAQQQADMDIVWFDRNPASGSFTDQSAVDPTDAEVATIIGWTPVGRGSYADLADNSVASVQVREIMKLNGTSLYGVLVARTTPTYVSTTDLVITVQVRQF